jgi:CelD/BcsL family acetyltransferase involved in cellulose biosynthesis
MISRADPQYAVTEETFDTVYAYWQDASLNLQWSCIFVTPAWLKVWWQSFGAGKKPLLLAVWSKKRLVGIAPLMEDNNEALLMGDPDVCDYLDFIVSPGSEALFFDILIEYLRKQGVANLDLRPIREDSSAYIQLVEIAKQKSCAVRTEPEDVSYEVLLPGSWDEYLMRLNGKQRHEVRRKFRRLYASSQVEFQLVENRHEIEDAMNAFLDLFKRNRSDKSAFMTEQMKTYFRSLAGAMEKANMLRVFLLKLDKVCGAAVLCFDDGSTVYLYNNSYDDQFRSLSVGILSKALSIEHAIGMQRKRYDFLKGAETYKRHLGGNPVALYRCRIGL